MGNHHPHRSFRWTGNRSLNSADKNYGRFSWPLFSLPTFGLAANIGCSPENAIRSSERFCQHLSEPRATHLDSLCQFGGPESQ
jgi:hypothetical protein